MLRYSCFGYICLFKKDKPMQRYEYVDITTFHEVVLSRFRLRSNSKCRRMPLSSTAVTSNTWQLDMENTAGQLRCAAGWSNTVFQRLEGKIIECKIFLMSLLEKWNYIRGSHLLLLDSICCCCLVTKLCPNLHDPMDCSTPGFLVLHYLPGLAQTHVHLVGDAIQPSLPLSPPSPPAFSLSQHQGLF